MKWRPQLVKSLAAEERGEKGSVGLQEAVNGFEDSGQVIEPVKGKIWHHQVLTIFRKLK